MGVTVQRSRLVLVWTTLLGLACGSNTGPAAGVDHLEIYLIPSRPFYPVADTLHAYVRGVKQDGSTVFVSFSGWQSLNPAVAAMDAYGGISARSKGQVTIQVEAIGLSARLTLQVKGTLHASDLNSSETWRTADGPHVVRGFLQVGAADTAVLTIEAGDSIYFEPKAGLRFGEIQPGRLMVLPGGNPVLMAGDSVGKGSWVGLSFVGPGTTELHNTTLRDCGSPTPTGILLACLEGATNVTTLGPEFLLDNVTIANASRDGIRVGPGVSFAPGSHDLSLTDIDGHIAILSPTAAGHFPAGGQRTGNADNSLWVVTGEVTDSLTWDPSLPWHLAGSVFVAGATEPALRLQAGTHITAQPGTAFVVGDRGRGSVVFGDSAGPPVVLEAMGSAWGGIVSEDGAVLTVLRQVVMKDCGLGIDACIVVFGDGPKLRVEDVTIQGSHSRGLRLLSTASFDSSSENLTVTGSADVPLELPADALRSLPSGDYRFNGVDAIRLQFGDVTHSARWRNLRLPYEAPDGISVHSPSETPVLTLDPGVVLRMGSATRVVVASTLKAVGTVSEPIIFESSTPGVAGAWIGVELGTAADTTTRLDHVEIRDAGAGTIGTDGALRLQLDPGGVLRNSTIIRSASCGIVLYSGNPWIDDYTDPSFGNSFIDIAGPIRCQL